MMQSEDMSTYYITTPIYYVNAEPHLGHAYTTIAADVASRHARQRGEDTFFLTGTDEHGAKVAQAAAAAGLEPKAWADPMAERFRELARALDAEYDFFIRTTDPEHEQFVQRFVEVLRERGHLFEGSYSGLYCTACEQFYREEELVDGRFCPQHGTEPEWTEEKNLFFRLSAFQDQLLAHYDAHPDFVLPRGRMNETRAFVESGLEDLSITRQGVTWGVPVPWDTAQSIYVWVDALLNYASAPTYARPGEDLSSTLLAAALAGAGQGHPALPRDHLARAADGGRVRAAAPAVHPRLPDRATTAIACRRRAGTAWIRTR